jgi:CheY-like chemotaxis protein/tetratricopeptide (TPR) repeat protein
MPTPPEDISVLIAADVAAVRAAVERALVSAGYRVRTAADGDTAATEVTASPPDIVVTVPDLPRIRGAEVLEIARRASGEKPVAGLFLVAAGDTRPMPIGALQAALRLPIVASAVLETVESLAGLLHRASPPPLDLPLPAPVAPVPKAASTEDDEIIVEEVDPESITLETDEGERVDGGRLSEKPLAAVLLTARRAGFTGHLVLEHGDVEKRVHLLHGRPVFCESNVVVETVGEMLLQEKAVGPEQLRDAHERMIAEGEHQSDALVAVGAIDREALAAALKRHVRERVVRAFAWEDAAWRLEETATDRVRVLDAELEPLLIAAEGVRRYTEPSRLLAFFDEHKARYPVPQAIDRETAALRALPGGARLAGILDGKVTLTEAQGASGLDELLFTQLMMTLWQGGLVALSDAPSEGPIEAHPGEDFVVAEALPEPPTDGAGPPAPEAGQETPIPVDPALREDILAVYTRLPHADPFDLLGVDPEVDEAGVGSAFAGWAARLGPDRVSEVQDPQLAGLAREVWLRLAEAYGALKEAEGRIRWRAERERRVAGAPGRTRWLDANRAFAAGLEHLSEARMEAAEEAFRAAAELNRREPVYRLHAAWASWCRARDAGEAETMAAEEAVTREAVEAIPILDQGWVFLGEMAKHRGDLDLARAHFERALLFDPASTAAKAALAALDYG